MYPVAIDMRDAHANAQAAVIFCAPKAMHAVMIITATAIIEYSAFRNVIAPPRIAWAICFALALSTLTRPMAYMRNATTAMPSAATVAKISEYIEIDIYHLRRLYMVVITI